MYDKYKDIDKMTDALKDMTFFLMEKDTEYLIKVIKSFLTCKKEAELTNNEYIEVIIRGLTQFIYHILYIQEEHYNTEFMINKFWKIVKLELPDEYYKNLI